MRRLTVIGLGLIGASCCAAIKKRATDWMISGYSRTEATRQQAVARGLIDHSFESVADAIAGADLVLVAVPMGQFSSIFSEIFQYREIQTVVTDAGSTKESVIREIVAQCEKMPEWFVPGHPIAGSEQNGVDAADPDLYVDHQVILTPCSRANADAVELVTSFWVLQGASVSKMDAKRHDEVLALTSHLPHILAFNLVHVLSDDNAHLDIFRFAAGGFRDFTRIAASDPAMWRDISLANHQSILAGIDRFVERLEKMREAIADADAEWIMSSFERARDARRLFSSLADQGVHPVTDSHPSVFTVTEAQKGITGKIRVPGDKSISHRSIMLGSLADGLTTVEGFLEGEDAIATIKAFRDMGVQIDGPNEGCVTIHGVGRDGLKAPIAPLYMGNSGTSMRLMCGILAGQSFDSELTGDSSLSRRPMRRISEPLSRLGAEIETSVGGSPPVKIKGGRTLKGCHIYTQVASAQVKSAMLLAALYAEGKTSITEPAPTRDHTERMLQGFGYEVTRDGVTASIFGGSRLKACHINIPSDISSAAFFLVAASIVPGSDLTLSHVGINPTRVGILEILNLMGADIEILNRRDVGGEPVADLRVRYGPLKGIKVPENLVPLAIDEFPILFVAASCAEGETCVSGAEELRVKESDRIQSMVDGLSILGAAIEGTPDGALIHGGGIDFRFSGGTVEACEDHRIAMAFSVAGLVCRETITVNDCANVATSFPNFVGLARETGFPLMVSP
ncbi:MAG: bifunctional prephenate dehydrogenase/3-phosphoshikimate 1-carboxyvinyltransferase [Gammaproteobacteria bacterium]|nr:bifunctional prephenate dehydrogenase/3-phosphoshikimate 1-carboxyvinyltransferase [Gammaproteobacteria bacterium]